MAARDHDSRTGWNTEGQVGGTGRKSIYDLLGLSLLHPPRILFRVLFLSFLSFYLSVSCLYSSLSVSVVICHCVSLPWDTRHTFLVLGLMCSHISLQTIVGTRPKGPLRIESAVPEGRL